MVDSDYDWEIVVAENSFVDRNTPYMKKLYRYIMRRGRLKYVFEPRDCGPVARNTGARLADGDFVMFMDAHTTLGKDSVAPLADYLTDHEECGSVAGLTAWSHYNLAQMGAYYEIFHDKAKQEAGQGGPSLPTHMHGHYMPLSRLGREWMSKPRPFEIVAGSQAYTMYRRDEFFDWDGYFDECYSDDTELLTENGWVLFKDLAPAIRVATLNPATNELEYHLPTKTLSYQYNGKMFCQEGRGVDVMVTPNHFLWLGIYSGKNRRQLDWKFVRASDAPRYTKYNRIAKWKGKEAEFFVLPPVSNKTRSLQRIPLKIPMDDWLRFIGIWLAEGSTCFSKGQHIIEVYQKPGKKSFTIIREWMEKLPFHININGGAFRIFHKQLYEYLSKLGHAREKRIPRELLVLSSRQLRILFDSMMLGDGDASGVRYSSASKGLVDDVQELLLKIGLAGTIGRGTSGFVDTPQYKVGISRVRLNQTVNWGVDRRSWKEYSGKVYCLNVPNHIIYVRRGGKAFWCGNCRFYPHPEGHVPLKVRMMGKTVVTHPWSYHIHGMFPRSYKFSNATKMLGGIAVILKSELEDGEKLQAIKQEMAYDEPDEGRMKIEEYGGWSWHEHGVRNVFMVAYILGDEKWLDICQRYISRKHGRKFEELRRSAIEVVDATGQREHLRDKQIMSLDEVLTKARKEKIRGMEKWFDEIGIDPLNEHP